MKKEYTPLPVKKWDKESLEKVLRQQYFKTLRKIDHNKKWTEETKFWKRNLAFQNFWVMYEPVIHDQITYKKIK